MLGRFACGHCWRIYRNDCHRHHAKLQCLLLAVLEPRFRPNYEWCCKSDVERLKSKHSCRWRLNWSEFQPVNPCISWTIHFGCHDRRCGLERFWNLMKAGQNIYPWPMSCLIHSCLKIHRQSSSDAVDPCHEACNLNRGCFWTVRVFHKRHRASAVNRQDVSWCPTCHDRVQTLCSCRLSFNQFKNSIPIDEFYLLNPVSNLGGGGASSAKRLLVAADLFLSRSLSSSYRSVDKGLFNAARFASSILSHKRIKDSEERKIRKEKKN